LFSLLKLFDAGPVSGFPADDHRLRRLDELFQYAFRIAHQADLSRKRPADVFWLEDRKSTRLNSSHVSNSYAVFCLKKKTASRLFTAEYLVCAASHHRGASGCHFLYPVIGLIPLIWRFPGLAAGTNRSPRESFSVAVLVSVVVPALLRCVVQNITLTPSWICRGGPAEKTRPKFGVSAVRLGMSLLSLLSRLKVSIMTCSC